jgi:hypothetical protein
LRNDEKQTENKLKKRTKEIEPKEEEEEEIITKRLTASFFNIHLVTMELLNL